jgi:cation diffusion facilitator family transporter
MASEERPVAVVAALSANLGIAVAKFVAFVFTRSSSMLAEGIHSLADTGNQVLLLVGHRRGKKAADELHPFGYGQERYFWALLVAVVLFTVGALFSLWEGYQHIVHPHEIESLPWAIGVLLVAMVLEGLSLTRAVEAAHRERRVSWWQHIRATKDPENSVVLLEDTAALAGLVIALLGVTLAHFTHQPRFDAVGSVGIGVLLAFVATTLAGEMRSLLVGESAQRSEAHTVEQALLGHESIERLVDLKTMHLGPERILVAARVQLADGLDTDGVARVLDEAEARITERLARDCVIYLEPERTNGRGAGSSDTGGADLPPDGDGSVGA